MEIAVYIMMALLVLNLIVGVYACSRMQKVGRTDNKEVVEFIRMLERWMVSFPYGSDVAHDLREAELNNAFVDYGMKCLAGVFPSMTDDDCLCFEALVRLWYNGKTSQYIMIDLCDRLYGYGELKVAKAIDDIAEFSQNEELKKAIEDE